MAIRNAQIAVDATRDLLARADADGAQVWVRNDGAQSVFLGDDTVTDSGATGGWEVPANTTLPNPIQMYGGEELYGVCAAGQSTTVHILRSGAN